MSSTSRTVLVLAPLVSLVACASMGFGTDTPKLVGTASFDHGCPKERISVVSEEPGSTGVTMYVLDVCGTKKKYKRAGTLYYDAEKGDPLPK